jgi:hypothetical protein
MGNRHYWFPVSDMHHDFDANLSWDTVGSQGGAFAFCAPGWQGVLPEGVQRVDVGTPLIWTLGRLAVRGDDDVPAAVALQQQTRLVPLSQWGKAQVARPKPDAARYSRLTRNDLTDARTYFTVLNELMRLTPRTGPPDGPGDDRLAFRNRHGNRRRDSTGMRFRPRPAAASNGRRPTLTASSPLARRV